MAKKRSDVNNDPRIFYDALKGWHAEFAPNRRKVSTGAVRDNSTGKGRFDLISPIAMRRLALALERGAEKYGENNWTKGMPFSWFVDSAMRHLCQWIAGETDEDHLASCFWNIHALIHTEHMVKTGKLPKKLANIGPMVKK